MNTLIKIIITTVLGLLGTFTEVEDSLAKIHGTQLQEVEHNSYVKSGINSCIFYETTCIMLKNKFDS